MGAADARKASHNPKVAGSNPAPAISLTDQKALLREGFLFL
jgi:hypothetical protein